MEKIKPNDGGDLMPIEDFIYYVEVGALNSYDGFGYFSDGKYTFETVPLLRNETIVVEENYTHVLWYNK